MKPAADLTLLWLLCASLGITVILQHSPIRFAGGRMVQAIKTLALGFVCALLIYRLLAWVLW